jgi:hypothetical protein
LLKPQVQTLVRAYLLTFGEYQACCAKSKAKGDNLSGTETFNGCVAPYNLRGSLKFGESLPTAPVATSAESIVQSSLKRDLHVQEGQRRPRAVDPEARASVI